MGNGESFGQLVKTQRRELGLTQDELARRVGCAPVTIRKIEHDDLRPSVQIAERLAMALNILAGGAGGLCAPSPRRARPAGGTDAHAHA